MNAAFERDGVVFLPGVVDGTWIERLRAAIERDIAQPGPFFHGYQSEGRRGRFHGNMRLWESDADFADYCQRSPLPELAAQLLEAERVVLFYDQLFVKEPGTADRTRWHNDQPYWPVRGWPVLSFWLALDPVTRQSGALEFIAGSHRWGRWFQPEPFAPGGAQYASHPDFETAPDFDVERSVLESEGHPFLSWDMAPGDVIAFHALTVHGAGGNESADVRRRGYTVRYCGDGARYYAGPGSHPDLRNPALLEGAPLESERYPQVWAAGSKSFG